jgi:WD repeat-containing protein 19
VSLCVCASGTVILYNRVTGERCLAAARHKKRITCGDWSDEDQLAFGSEDRQISICSNDGEVIDMVSQCTGSPRGQPPDQRIT